MPRGCTARTAPRDEHYPRDDRQARDREGRPPAPSPAGVRGHDGSLDRPRTAVPDWSASAAADIPSPGPTLPDPAGSAGASAPVRDYAPLDTRAEVIAALREDHRVDPVVRRTVDEVVSELSFLGRPRGALADLGCSSAPRGMRWWWIHLGGSAEGTPDHSSPSGPGDRTEHPDVPSSPVDTLAVQLRLIDVQAGYGDH